MNLPLLLICPAGRQCWLLLHKSQVASPRDEHLGSMSVWILLTDDCSLLSAMHLLNFRYLLTSIAVNENTGGHTSRWTSVRLICKQVLCWTEISGPWTTQRAMLGTVGKKTVQKSVVSHWWWHWHTCIWGSYVLRNAVSHYCLPTHCHGVVG